MKRWLFALSLMLPVLTLSGGDASAATPPPSDPVPQDEIDYLVEVFTIHATSLSNVGAFDYVACDAEWAADGSISAICFGQAGTQIMSSLIVHASDGITIVAVGLYTLGVGWTDPALTMTAEAAPLPTPGAGPAPAPAATVPPATVPPAPTTTVPAGPASTFGDGSWLVGTDIAPGQYRAPGGDGCYWARLADLSGEDIIANEFSDSATQVLVEIAATDVVFESDGCGTWEPI